MLDEPLTRPQRIVSGVVLLAAVDLIWVASSELTGYIFHDLDYDKPFFSTYFKTSLFMTYLAGFAMYRPWRERLYRASARNLSRLRRQRRYDVRTFVCHCQLFVPAYLILNFLSSIDDSHYIRIRIT